MKIAKLTLKKAGVFLAAALLYAAFATFLFWPDSRIDYVFIFSTTTAAIGTCLLSRRWIADQIGAFFAGALYGFGPFFISLVRFHWSVNILAAMIPWLFLPSVFAPAPAGRKLLILKIALCFLPFLAIIIFFQLSSRFRLYAVPIDVMLRPIDLTSFIWPLAAAEDELNPVGLYHIAAPLFFIGLLVMLKARRYKVMAVLLIGIILAFCPSFFQISPIIWFAIPSLGFAILAGEGFGGLVLAGFVGRFWVLAAAFLSVLCSIIAFIFTAGFQGKIFSEDFKALFAYSGRFHLLAALICVVIFFMAKDQLRLNIVRSLLISAALCIDIFLCAGYLAGSLS